MPNYPHSKVPYSNAVQLYSVLVKGVVDVDGVIPIRLVTWTHSALFHLKFETVS